MVIIDLERGFKLAVIYIWAMVGNTFCGSAQLAPTENSVHYAVDLGWASKYVSEGRDNLEDGGLGSVEAVAGHRGFEAGIWYALADTVAYDELNLFIQYGVELEFVELYAGYTRLEFLKDDTYDNEFYVGMELICIPRLVPALEYVHSTEAQGGDGGGFVEFSLSVPIELLDGELVLEPYVLEGFDFGYASDNYDGFNNFQFGVVACYALLDGVTLKTSVNHSIANQDVRKDGDGDLTWVTVGLGVEF